MRGPITCSLVRMGRHSRAARRPTPSRSPPSKERTSMGNPVTFFEIVGPDVQVLQDFYSKVFDWRLDSNPFPGYAYMTPGDTGATKAGLRQEKEAPAERVIYVSVPDVAAALEAVTGAGGTVVLPPQTVPGVPTFALF